MRTSEVNEGVGILRGEGAGWFSGETEREEESGIARG